MIYDESKIIEDGFAQSLDRVNVTIERRKQWFIINPPIKVIIDDDMSYILRASSSVVVPMAPGMHKFHFIGSLRSKELETDVQNDSNIVLKWNRVWGTLEASLS